MSGCVLKRGYELIAHLGSNVGIAHLATAGDVLYAVCVTKTSALEDVQRQLSRIPGA